MISERSSQCVGGSGSRLALGATPVNLAPAYVVLDAISQQHCQWLVCCLGDRSATASGQHCRCTAVWVRDRRLSGVPATSLFTSSRCVWRAPPPPPSVLLTRRECRVGRRRGVLLVLVVLPARISSLLGPSTAVSARSLRVIVTRLPSALHSLLSTSRISAVVRPTSVSSAWESHQRKCSTINGSHVVYDNQ